MLKHAKAFLLGMYEFKTDWTTNFDHVATDEGYSLQESYDYGRELAHKLTFRKYDQSYY